MLIQWMDDAYDYLFVNFEQKIYIFKANVLREFRQCVQSREPKSIIITDLNSK